MDRHMIEGVVVEPLKQIADSRGKVMHMIRADSPFYSSFGEIYFSQVNPGVIKGWKKHSKITQHFAVPVGEIEVVLYDDREESKTINVVDRIKIGEQHYSLVVIPPCIWYAFKGISDVPALIANYIDMPYDALETESVSLDAFSMPFEGE